MAERVFQVVGLFTCSLKDIVLVLQPSCRPQWPVVTCTTDSKQPLPMVNNPKKTADILVVMLFIAVILWYRNMLWVSFR